jgi:acetyl-CoA acyltransferase
VQREPVIVDVVRTPVGRRAGALSEMHPASLLALTLRALVERNGAHLVVEDVIAGCVSQTGEQSLNIARTALLAAGFPHTVPGTTIDRQCGSGQQAVHFAAQGVQSGAYDAVIACGVESMSRVPLGSSFAGDVALPFAPLHSRYGTFVPNQGLSAERIAREWRISRADLDEFAAQSHRRARASWASGAWQSQIVVPPEVTLTRDEGIREDCDLERLSQLKSAFTEDGVVTAGNSSQISDGAAAVLIMEKRAAQLAGLPVRARFASFSVVGDDPELMLMATVPATRDALARADLRMSDIDRFEVNEAFASNVIAWMRDLDASRDKVNVNGGAIAIGHPLGATGVRLLGALLMELERHNMQYGLQTLCEGGGMANAMIVERLVT